MEMTDKPAELASLPISYMTAVYAFMHLARLQKGESVLVQSAAVYSATLASLLGTYLAGSNAQYICLDLLTPIIVRPLPSPLLPSPPFHRGNG